MAPRKRVVHDGPSSDEDIDVDKMYQAKLAIDKVSSTSPMPCVCDCCAFWARRSIV